MKRPFIVAELSANHCGELGTMLQMVDAAARAGADAVKLQTWTPGTMCIKHDAAAYWQDQPQNLPELYRQAHTPWDWHPKVFDAAKAAGIGAFSSPFDVGAVDFLETLGCSIYKIASFELVDLELIRYVASTGKPMIMSTGMATKAEIFDALQVARAAGARDITLLHCTSAYPAYPEDASLDTMTDMAKWTGCEVGLSDHTKGIGVPIAAAALGADVIEKHMTLYADTGLDGEFSLDPATFQIMAKACREAYVATVGAPAYGPTKNDRVDLRRSLYFARDMKAGEAIQATDIVTARPALGMPPKWLNIVLGSLVTADVSRGTPVHPEAYK